MVARVSPPPSIIGKMVEKITQHGGRQFDTDKKESCCSNQLDLEKGLGASNGRRIGKTVYDQDDQARCFASQSTCFVPFKHPKDNFQVKVPECERYRGQHTRCFVQSFGCFCRISSRIYKSGSQKNGNLVMGIVAIYKPSSFENSSEGGFRSGREITAGTRICQQAVIFIMRRISIYFISITVVVDEDLDRC